MTDSPFFQHAPAVYIVRHVRITTADEVVIENANNITRYAGELLPIQSQQSIMIVCT